MRRKYETLDVVRLYSTLSVDVWRAVLSKCLRNGDINRLMSIRYGLQAGLSDATKKGFVDDKFTFWVLKRIKNIERVAKEIIKNRNPMPGDKVELSKTHKGKRIDFVQDAKLAKKLRDKELENFMKESSF